MRWSVRDIRGQVYLCKVLFDQQLPVPHRDMVPVSLEEQVICFADKFFSKTHLDKEKSVEKALKSISRYGEDGIIRLPLVRMFLVSLKNKLNIR